MEWVYRLSDGVFLRDKWTEPLATGEGVVEVTGTPDAALERADLTAPTGRRVATAQEVTDAGTARREAQATRLRDDVVSVALARVTWEEMRKCQVRAGQTALSWDEFRAALKAEIVARLNV